MVIGKVGVRWTQELRSGAPEPHIPPGKGRRWSPTPQSCEGRGRTGAAATGHELGWAPGAGRTCTPRGAAPSTDEGELRVLDSPSTSPPRPHQLVSWLHNLFLAPLWAGQPQRSRQLRGTLLAERIGLQPLGFSSFMTIGVPSLWRERPISHG